jgi:hypothetical protein
LGGGGDNKGTVSKKSGSADEPSGLSIEDIVRLLNSFFRSARIDARISDFYLAREEVVIGFPEQIESFEKELKDIKLEEEAQRAGRYVARVVVFSSGREVTSIVRFYKKVDGDLIIEDAFDNEVTLGERETIGKSKRWEQVAQFCKSIAELAVKTAVELWMRRAL